MNSSKTVDEAQIREIAGELIVGMKCYIHSISKEIVSIPDQQRWPDADMEPWNDTVSSLDDHQADYVVVEGMNTRQSFQVMEDFIDTVDDTRVKQKLIDALNGKKPFQRFKFTIDNAGKYGQEWFDFKEMRTTEWVKRQLTANGLWNEDEAEQWKG